MIIYTDGACSGNPGPGGFGVVVCSEDEQITEEYSEHCEKTTNNREEIKAIIYAMENYGCRFLLLNEIPVVYSDSAYCVNMFNEWIYSWAANGWRRSKNQEILNLDLVQKYWDLYNKGYRIDLRKIKGHAGYKGNERADALATGKISPSIGL